MLQPFSRFAAPLVLLALAVTTPAVAKDKAPPPRPAQIQELYACRDIADPAGRLACFDREVGELANADQAREIVFTDKETAKKTRRGLFGFTLPSLGLFGGDDDADKIERVETTIASVADGADGYRMEMADGSLWVQTDGKRMPLRPRIGQKVEIKSGTLGTFFLSLQGRPSVKVRRER